MTYSLVLALLAAIVVGTSAYPRGAMNNASNPMDTLSSYCTTGNFRPNHADFLPQATPAPFSITLFSQSGDIYKPGQPVTISIEGKGARTFKGFFLQGDGTEASFAGELSCPGYGHQVNFCARSGITHSDPTPKTKVQCRWTPPDFQIGNVQFTATIVENFSSFWTGVKSDVNLSPDPTTMTYEQKSVQLREQLLGKFRQNAAVAGLLGQSQNQGQPGLPGIANNLASWFGGQNSNTNNNNNNNHRRPMQNNAFALSRNTGLGMAQFQKFFGAQ